jgi:hypothetical protein
MSLALNSYFFPTLLNDDYDYDLFKVLSRIYLNGLVKMLLRLILLKAVLSYSL